MARKTGVLPVQRIALADGVFTAVWSERGLFRLIFPQTVSVPERAAPGTRLPEKTALSAWQETLAELLAVYFSGRAVDFSSVPVDFEGYTPFQRRVLSVVRQVPYGKVTTYGNVAREIKQARAARAVGQVMKRNRTMLVIPCHRVLGQNGLGGFSCGTSFKECLLRLEGILC
ncbi:MAG: methylated-DNA--[protein]-cysteine S-methyltransferase [Bacillota bacterium]